MVAVPFFLSAGAEVTIDSMLDHIDYIANLASWRHVAICTDCPPRLTKAALAHLSDLEGQYGLRPEHRISWTTYLIGFDDYRDFRDITRGLVKRGLHRRAGARDPGRKLPARVRGGMRLGGRN